VFSSYKIESVFIKWEENINSIVNLYFRIIVCWFFFKLIITRSVNFNGICNVFLVYIWIFILIFMFKFLVIFNSIFYLFWLYVFFKKNKEMFFSEIKTKILAQTIIYSNKRMWLTFLSIYYLQKKINRFITIILRNTTGPIKFLFIFIEHNVTFVWIYT